MYTHAYIYIYIHTHIHIHICQETIPTAKKISMNLRTVCPLMSVTVCQEAMGKIAVVRWDQEDMYSWTHKTSTQIPSAFLSPAMGRIFSVSPASNEIYLNRAFWERQFSLDILTLYSH